MRTHPSLRLIAFLSAGLVAPLFLTQCKTTTKSYKDVSYDPAKLKTPPGHGMEKKNYPFDEQGAYRKDWVKSNTSGRDRSAQPGAAASTEVASATTEAGETTPGSTSYPTYAEASEARKNGAFVGPAGDGAATTLAATPVAESGSDVVLASAPVDSTASSARYHKVTSGDTLFSLASKYHTSVSDLKRVNGLTGDSIRSGQSLRIP